jgi:hypothetical protein
MKTLRIRDQLTAADPLQLERVLKALTIILEHQEAPDASSLLGARLDQSATTRRDYRESTTRTQTLHSAL